MAAPLVADSFWKHLSESGLLTNRQVAAWNRDVAAKGLSSDAEAASELVTRRVLTRFQADRLLEGRSRGFFFDEYKLLDLLGVGGMGWVYQAAHCETGQMVAIKVLLDQFKNDRGMLARFQQEAHTTLRLNHPNIIRTHRLGSAGGSHYMIMDLVEGPSLLELLLKRKRLPWGQACDIARQAALGLHHAHEAGLIHRDVKPQNLLIESTGLVKLLDFGLAMIVDGEGGDEFSMAMIFGHECVGTAAFMSPEQAEDSLAVDARSDVYSLGCTLFAALTGETPFPERSVTDVQNSHRVKPPRSVRDLVPATPDGVDRIVARMLAKKPQDRFASAAEVAAALEEWSESTPLEFDFSKVLNERKKHARDKMAEYLKSRPRISGAASSTMRPNAISSVAQAVPEVQANYDATGHPILGESPRDPGSHSVSTALLNEMSRPLTQGHREASSIESSGAVLVPCHGGRYLPLVSERIVIGRREDCDLQLHDAAVSGRHCEFHFDGSQWWITDLGSRNGTQVNGSAIKHRLLSPGDEIMIGNHLRFRLDYVVTSATSRGSYGRLALIGTGIISLILTLILLASWWRLI